MWKCSKSVGNVLVAFGIVIIIGMVASGSGPANAKTIVWKIDADTVKKACGDSIKSGEGQTGCTKCGKSGCRDYNCSDGTGGIPKGCTRTTVGKTAPGQTKGGTPVNVGGISQGPSGGTTTSKGKGNLTPTSVGGSKQTGSGSQTSGNKK